MLIGMSLLGIGLMFIGWGIHNKQWHGLISGYNTMSEEEKKKVDISGLAKSLSYMTYVLGVLLILLGVTIQFNYFSVLPVVTLLIIVIPIGFLFYSKRFYPKGMYLQRNLSSKNKKITIFLSVISLLVVGALIYMSLQPTTFVVRDKDFEIKGLYGDAIVWTEMKNIQLVDELPSIGVRTNGSAIGSIVKGNFKLENGQVAKLFVDKRIDMYIMFELDGTTYILNDQTKEKTERLFIEFEQRSAR